MRVCLFVEGRIVLTAGRSRLPSRDVVQAWLGREVEGHSLGPSYPDAVLEAVPPDWSPGDRGAAVSIRRALTLLDPDEARLALTAAHHLRWRSTSRFCGVCGNPTEEGDGGRAMRCTACGHLTFPKVSPAIIVQVYRDDHILLGRSRRHPPGYYSVLAGFVDPGESLEEAVHREILEESGILVRNLRYFGSQPWPFPDSLMVGFTAEYAGGEIRTDDDEMEDVAWFAADALPPVPPTYSIARTLIDDFVARHGVAPADVPTWTVPGAQ